MTADCVALKVIDCSAYGVCPMAREINLLPLVVEIDTQLIEEGLKPFQRPLHTCTRIADKLGISVRLGGIGGADPLVDAVHAIYDQLYRKSDLYMPPLHVGAFMFRDVFFPIRIPVIYGTAGINPVSLLQDISDFQKEWLFSDKFIGHAFFDQCIDLMDFVYSLEDGVRAGQHTGKALEFWRIAKRQLEGAAATLFGSFDQQSVVQNSCIAVELLLKGALVIHGYTEKELKNDFSHGLLKMADAVSDCFPGVDRPRLSLVVGRMPHLVKSRYEGKEETRTMLGRIVMDAQFVAGEILRQFSARNFRVGVGGDPDWDVTIRRYPS